MVAVLAHSVGIVGLISMATLEDVLAMLLDNLSLFHGTHARVQGDLQFLWEIFGCDVRSDLRFLFKIHRSFFCFFL